MTVNTDRSSTSVGRYPRTLLNIEHQPPHHRGAVVRSSSSSGCRAINVSKRNSSIFLKTRQKKQTSEGHPNHVAFGEPSLVNSSILSGVQLGVQHVPHVVGLWVRIVSFAEMVHQSTSFYPFLQRTTGWSLQSHWVVGQNSLTRSDKGQF